MKLTDLEQNVLLALLEYGKGHLNSLGWEQLGEILRCDREQLESAAGHLVGLRFAGCNSSSVYLTTEGRELARELQAAPERERQDAAEARRQFWLRTLGWVLKAVFVGVVLSLVALYLAKYWGLNP